jgi:hypothetical protein
MKRTIGFICLLFVIAASSIGGHASPLAVGVAHADACSDSGEWPDCSTECAVTGNACDEGSDGDTDYGWICATTGNDCPEEAAPEEAPPPDNGGSGDNGGDGGGGGSTCSGLTGNPSNGAVALNAYWIPDPDSFNALGQNWGAINWCGEPDGGLAGEYLSANATIGSGGQLNGPMLRPGWSIILIPGWNYKRVNDEPEIPVKPPRKGVVSCSGASVVSPIGIIVVTGLGSMTCRSDEPDDPVTGMTWVLCLEVQGVGPEWLKTWGGCVGGHTGGDEVADSVTVDCNPGRYMNVVWRAAFTGTASTPRGGFKLWESEDILTTPSYCRLTPLPPPAVPPLP